MINKKLKLTLFSAPFFLIIGLGILSLSSPDPSAVHPFLEDTAVRLLLLAIGGIGASISLYKAINTFKEEQKEQ